VNKTSLSDLIPLKGKTKKLDDSERWILFPEQEVRLYGDAIFQKLARNHNEMAFSDWIPAQPNVTLPVLVEHGSHTLVTIGGNHGESCTTGENRLVQDASDIGLMMAHLSDGVIGVREVKGESTTAVKPPNVMATRGPPAVLSLEVYGSLISNA